MVILYSNILSVREVRKPTLARVSPDFRIYSPFWVSCLFFYSWLDSLIIPSGPNVATGHASVIFSQEAQVSLATEEAPSRSADESSLDFLSTAANPAGH